MAFGYFSLVLLVMDFYIKEKRWSNLNKNSSALGFVFNRVTSAWNMERHAKKKRKEKKNARREVHRPIQFYYNTNNSVFSLLHVGRLVYSVEV